jgi:hypothetical protein
VVVDVRDRGAQALLTIFVLSESLKASDDDTPPSSLRDIPRAFMVRGVAPVLWQKLIFALGIYDWFGAFTLILQGLVRLYGHRHELFFCLFGVAGLIAQLTAVNRISQTAGELRGTNLGYALLLCAFAIVPFALALWAAGGMIALFSLGLAPVNASLPAQPAPETLRGTILGAASSLDSVAGVFMPVVTTYAPQAGGVLPATAIPFALVAIALAVGVAQATRGPQLRPAAPDAP